MAKTLKLRKIAKKSEKLTTAPALGERKALRGYVNQTNFQISLVIQSLLKDKAFVSAEFTNIKAGVWDDLILNRSNEIVCYQFKRRQSGKISFSTLCGSSGLLREFAQSWLDFKRNSPGKTLRLEFVATSEFNDDTKAKIPFDKRIPPYKPSFKAFYLEALLPYKKAILSNITSPEKAILKPWLKTFETWKESTGLTLDQFRDFHSGFSIKTGIQPNLVGINSEDIDFLFRHFQTLVSEAESKQESIVVTGKQLIKLLNEKRFYLRNIHEFSLPREYQRIEKTSSVLSQKILSYKSGYLALLGNPGSGKSTLLTDLSKNMGKNIRFVTYYTYLETDKKPIVSPRGSVINFLNDITKLIDESLKQVVVPPKNEIDPLCDKLGSQFKQIHADYLKTNKKTIIIIDGLDHIKRPDSPQINDSFLGYLPDPNLIPEGLIIILGSQHLKLNHLRTDIVSHINSNNYDRLIKMSPLNIPETEQILNRSQLSTWLKNGKPYEYKERLNNIHSLTEGHPLSTIYFVQWIKDMSNWQQLSPDNVIKRLQKEPQIIGQDYSRLWNEIEKKHTGFKYFAGLISRIEGDIDFEWIETWNEYSQESILFQDSFAHFFKKSIKGSWKFFHSSFRLFLNKKSLEGISSQSQVRNEGFHNKLVDKCLNAPKRFNYRWNVIYHLSKSGRIEEVFKIATSDFFLEQYLCYRPLSDISRDVNFCLKEAVKVAKSHLIIRYLILQHRFMQAATTWGLSSFENKVNHLLSKINLKENSAYRISSQYENYKNQKNYIQLQDLENALVQINMLFSNNENIRATELFENFNLEEIIDDDFLMIDKRRSYSDDQKENFLVSWAYSASNFYGLNRILSYIKALPWRTDKASDLNIGRIRENLYFQILNELAKRFIYSKQFEKYENVISELERSTNELKGGVSFWWVDLWLIALGGCCDDKKRKNKYLGHFLNRFSVERLKVFLNKNKMDKKYLEARTTAIRQILELLPRLGTGYSILVKKYASLISYNDFIEFTKEDLSKDITVKFDEKIERIEAYIFTEILNSRWKEDSAEKMFKDLREGVKYPDDDKWHAIRQLIKSRSMVLEINSWTNQEKSRFKDVMFQYCDRIFSYIYEPSNKNWEFRYVNNIGVEKRNYFQLINSIASCGNDYLNDLVNLIDDIWNRRNIVMPLEVRASVIEDLNNYPVDQKWLAQETDRLIKQTVEIKDGNLGVIEQILRQAEIAADIGRIDIVHSLLKKSLLVAFSVRSEKDHQLSSLMSWLPLQLKLANSNSEALEQIKEAAQQIYLNSQGSDGTSDSLIEFFIATAKFCPKLSIQLLQDYVIKHLGSAYLDEIICGFIDHIKNENFCLSRNSLPDELLSVLISLYVIYCLPVQYDGPSQHAAEAAKSLVLLSPDSGYFSKIITANKLLNYSRQLFPVSTEQKKFINHILSAIPINIRHKIKLLPQELSSLDDPSFKEGTEQPYPLATSKKNYHREEIVELILKNPEIAEKILREENKPEEGRSYARFNWVDVIKRVEYLLTEEKNNHLLKALIRGGCDNKNLLRLMLDLLGRGSLKNPALAEKFAEQVVLSEKKSSRGWVKYFDGEHKLLAFMLLKRINSRKWKNLIFNEFLDGLEEGFYFLGLIDISIELNDLFSNENESPSIQADIVRNDRKLIYSGFTESDPLSLNLTITDADKKITFFEAAINLLIDQLNLPINYLAEKSYTELAYLCRAFGNKVYKIIGERLNKENRWLILDMLLLLLEYEIKNCKPYKKELIPGIIACTKQENYAVVATARKLLRIFGKDIPKITFPIHKPPLIIIPPEKKIIQSEFGGPLEGQKNETYGINPIFSYELAILANVLNVSREEIRGRIAFFINKIEEEYSPREYNWVRSSYIRSSALKTREAINRYVHYIQIDNWEKYELPDWADMVFRGHDPKTVFLFPETKPNWIKEATVWPEHSYSQEHAIAWANSLDANYIKERIPRKIENEWDAIFENSKFEFGGDFKNTETRSTNFSINDNSTNKKDVDGCDCLTDCKYDNYRSNNFKENIKTVVVRIDNFRFLNACTSWYGLNPKIAFALGLTCDDSFPPKWRDYNGNVVCYSMVWKNGCWAHRHYTRNDPCSEGWAILIKRKFLKKIFAYLARSYKAVPHYKTTFERRIFNVRISQFDPIFKKIEVISSGIN